MKGRLKRGRRKGQEVKTWTQDDLDFLKASYLFFTDEEIGKILGRTGKTIHSIRRKYGWFKAKNKKDYEDLCKKIPIVFLHKREEFKSDRELVLETLKDGYETTDRV